jgi:hypothetical protein
VAHGEQRQPHGAEHGPGARRLGEQPTLGDRRREGEGRERQR